VRELEFLPTWYGQARSRYRWLRLQAGTTLLLVAGLGLWLGLAQRNIRTAEASLNAVDLQLAQSQLELEQLQVQLRLKNQLEFQRQIVTRLGMQVEVSRMLNTLERLMPKEMSLTELTFDTAEEIVKRPDGTTPNDRNATKSRSLRVKLLGVAPSDVDLANFLSGLTNVPFFQEVSLTYARDKSQGGHVMREFEVAFNMSLNPPSE
jgi:Tfp pilus assembly protein PilN